VQLLRRQGSHHVGPQQQSANHRKIRCLHRGHGRLHLHAPELGLEEAACGSVTARQNPLGMAQVRNRQSARMRKRMVAACQHHHIFRHEPLVLQSACRIVIAQRAQNEIDIARAQPGNQRFIGTLVGHHAHARVLRAHAGNRFGKDQCPAKR
jgi:hypothetical protein